MGIRYDDEIYEHTIKAFPELAEPPHEKLIKLDEDWMKSVDGKNRWREFIQQYVLIPPNDFPTRLIYDEQRYENKIQDYSFGSLIRADARGEYGEANTIFGEWDWHQISPWNEQRAFVL